MAEYIINGKEYMEGFVGDPIRFNRELVRCKDCNNGVIHCENGDIICDHVDSNGNDTHPADWFCADGERK